GTKLDLAKMLIGGQRVAYAVVLHNQEGNAIRQAASFVGSIAVQVPTALPKCRQKRNDLHVCAFFEMLDQRHSGRSPTRTGKCIGSFEQYRGGGDDSPRYALRPGLCSLMMLVLLDH